MAPWIYGLTPIHYEWIDVYEQRTDIRVSLLHGHLSEELRAGTGGAR